MSEYYVVRDMIVDVRERLEIIVIVYVVRDMIVDGRERLEIVGIVGALLYAPSLRSHTQVVAATDT